MPGHKSTVIDEFEPRLFVTFDGDEFDSGTGDLKDTNPGRVIIDESGNNVSCVLQTISDPTLGHRLGDNSLVELEQVDQHCLSLAPYGYAPGNVANVWPVSFIEVLHSSQWLDLPDGNVSVSFFLDKTARETEYRTITSKTTASLTRPLLNKGDAFNIRLKDIYYYSDALEVEWATGETTTYDIAKTSGGYADFYGEKNHIVVTYETRENPELGWAWGVFGELYVNGVNVASYSKLINSLPPSLTNTDSIYVGYDPDSSTADNNHQTTSLTKFDQIAVFDYVLTHDDVATLFKKTRSYERIVQGSNPGMYWPMQENEDVNNNVMVALAGGLPGVYGGVINGKTRQGDPGPAQIPLSKSVFFNGGGASVYRASSSYYSAVFNPSADYSISAWVSVSSSLPGAIVSLQNPDSPYGGIVVFANQRNGQPAPGHLQFSTSEDYKLSTSGVPPLLDGNLHLVTAVYRGTSGELWVDGTKVAEGLMSRFSPNHNLNQLHLMNRTPAYNPLSGNMAHLVLHSRALAPAEIRMMYRYGVSYRLEGTITLQGMFYGAEIRVNSYRTGELVTIGASSPSTGKYSIDLLTDMPVTVTVLDPSESNIRPRIFAPIVPAVMQDGV